MITSDQNIESALATLLAEGLPECRACCRRLEASTRELGYAGHEILVHGVSWGETPPGSRISPHQHSYYEALLIVEGRATETVGRRQLLLPGTMQLHVPGSVHGWSAPDSPLHRFAICFSLTPALPLRATPEWPVQLPLMAELGGLLSETRRLTPGLEERLQAGLLLFLSRFLDLLEWPVLPLRHEDKISWSLVEMVDQFLRDNLNRPLTLADVATVTSQSIPTLTRRYREQAGHSVIDRFNELRLEHAARLLTGSDMPVKEIAGLVGFTEPSYFCRRFRSRFHISPQCYRKQTTR